MPDGSIALRRDDSCGFDAIFAAIGLSGVDVVDPVGVPEGEPDDVPLVDPVGVVVVDPDGAVDVLCGLPCVDVVVVFGPPLVFGLPCEFAGALGPWVCGAAPFGPDAITGAV